MGQELIALNGNEQFPYQLTANDIANAMGLPNGIAPGGVSTGSYIAANEATVILGNNAWNNVVQVNNAVSSITLPDSCPTGALIYFVPGTAPLSNTQTYTINASSSQKFIYLPTTGENTATANTESTTSIVVPMNQSIVLYAVQSAIFIIGGSYLVTNNIGVSNILGALTINPLYLSRNNASSQNLLVNGSWLYGLNTGWTYSSGLLCSVAQITNFNSNTTLQIVGPNNNSSFTITSSNISMGNMNTPEYIFSGLFLNRGENTSGGSAIASSTYDVTVSLNLYDSSNSLLETILLVTCPAGSMWTFLQSEVINETTSSSLSSAAYMNIVIAGQLYENSTEINISQLKFEYVSMVGNYSAGGYNGLDLPTLYSDEASILQYSNNSFSGSGYQKLPSGMIMQWGEAANTGQSGSTPGTATFPLAFPNACFQVLMTDSGSNDYRYWTNGYTTTSFSLGAMETDASGTATYVASGDATGRFMAYGW